MKRQKVQDERILAQRRKIYSEAYSILMIGLLLSMLIQQFLLNAPFEQYAAELICFLGMGIYVAVRYLTVGLNLYEEGTRTKIIPLVNGVITGIVVTAVNGILNYTQYAERYKADGIGYFIAMLAVTFISASLIACVVLYLVGYLNKKNQDKIQRQLDENEEDD